jgi:hypothetical protein
MPHPDEGLIHAWLDGELDAVEAVRVEALVANDPEWAAAAADARGLVAASSRILRALDHVPGDVMPRHLNQSPRRVPGWWMMRAAALLLVVAGSVVVLRQRDATQVLQDVAPPAMPAPASGPGAMLPKEPPKIAVNAQPKATSAAEELAAMGASAPASARPSARDAVGQSLGAASPDRRRVDAPSRAALTPQEPAALAAPAALLAKAQGVVAAPPPSPASAAGAVAAPKDVRAERPFAENRAEKKITALRTPALNVEVTCYLVRLPLVLAGRTVLHPVDSASRAIWAGASINPDSLVVRNDSLLSRTLNGVRESVVRVVAVRSACPGR